MTEGLRRLGLVLGIAVTAGIAGAILAPLGAALIGDPAGPLGPLSSWGGRFGLAVVYELGLWAPATVGALVVARGRIINGLWWAFVVLAAPLAAEAVVLAMVGVRAAAWRDPVAGIARAGVAAVAVAIVVAGRHRRRPEQEDSGLRI